MEDRPIAPPLLRGVNPSQPEKVKKIAASMRTQGWQGRPLLVEEGLLGRLFAWTGSHRIEAAMAVELPKIPCRVITRVESQAALDRLPGAYGYNSLRDALTNPRNGGGPGDARRLQGLQSLGLEAAAAALNEEIQSEEW